jgi:hypothetical protein
MRVCRDAGNLRSQQVGLRTCECAVFGA